MRHRLASTRKVKLRLCYGAAALALSAGAAAAQTLPVLPGGRTTPTERPFDGLPAGGAVLESDAVFENRTNRTWTALGSVEARHEGRTIRADEVVYHTDTGIAVARGNVVLINPDGSINYADEVELAEDFRAGVALGFATRMEGNVSLAAASAVRRSENLNELNRAIYTACNLCRTDGKPRTPTWSVSAERVTQDHERGVVYYRNAVFKVAGVPVAYTPVFWHPDPTIPRRSGLLIPEVGLSERLGFTYEQPYLWVISPYSDLVISPMLSTRVNPFLNLDYRKRFYSGELHARFGYTHEQDFNEDLKFGDDTSRSYVLADGAFEINPDWRWGFSAERVSDDLLFDKYDIGDVYEPRGLYEPDHRRLLSQLYAVRQTESSYLSAAILEFQGLRATDVDSTFPTVGLVEGRTTLSQPVFGGRLRGLLHSAVLERDENQVFGGPLLGPGLDSRRLTGELDWRRAITFRNGMRLEPFVLARGDAYHIGDVPTAGPVVTFEDHTKTRFYGSLGVDASWPFIRPLRNGSIVLEPLVQAVFSNESDRDPLIPNEDSLSFEFDETTLFEPNKFPGYDRFEGGARLNMGGRATFDWGGGRNASVLVGRSFRAERDEVFPERVGLREKASDWIVAATFTPYPGVSIANRSRLDGDTLEVQRSETRASVSLPRLFLSAGHLKDVLDATGTTREDLDFYGRAKITNHFGVLAYGVRDQEAGVWRRRDLGVFYEDECTLLEVVYEREETFNRTLGPSESVRVRLVLNTLGQGLTTGDRYVRQR